MQGENYTLLTVELKRDEGVRRVPYKDTKGIDTVAVGHNLQAKPLPNAVYPLTDAAIDSILYADLCDVFSDLDSHLPWWQDLNDVRQRVLANMCFNLGITKLGGFMNTLAAMRQGRWADASAGMLNSAWASQVGDRAKRLAQMMKTGVCA
ncbi:glycoside hydrolase family protein [Paraburkholderia sp. J8-2]|uniref:glycoside hydrolase family protein n=1 Tax=Paraburkholderia sp. J8-2 TaxID=2805440 RepID=UPI002AB7D4FF|nr:glycoside hydrolase family protein [Paraburkholderia sp. J8-2]